MQKVRLMLADECNCNVWPLHSVTLKTLGVYNIFESGDEFSSLLVFWTIADIAQWFVFGKIWYLTLLTVDFTCFYSLTANAGCSLVYFLLLWVKELGIIFLYDCKKQTHYGCVCLCLYAYHGEPEVSRL